MNQTVRVTLRDGSVQSINQDKVNRAVKEACDGLPGASWSAIASSAKINWYDGVSTSEIDRSVVMAARQLTEQHPDYAYAAARLLLRVLYQDVFGPEAARSLSAKALYRERFAEYIQTGVREGMLDPRLLDEFNMQRLAAALDAGRDRQFKIQGMQILNDRYLLRDRKKQIIELPQWFWMRVAMGLTLATQERLAKTQRAITFYDLMSTFRYVPSTPTLFNSGSAHPQLSSCYLNTVPDSLKGIFDAYSEIAELSKWAGGIGTDWSNVRATGATIRGTNGEGQGIVPWLRVDNAIAVAVNQGGRRRGAHCAYLETWHLDIEDFLELRKNTGDERRRAPDIHMANWIPDLFMKRVIEDASWTLFSPDEVPDLHELYGKRFEEAYERRERDYEMGKIRGKHVRAKDLWRRMLTMLYETGHPWITFKDPCNVRSPQSHAGVVHNSNLCTEIVLNTSNDETAVCNIGSINLRAHVYETEHGADLDWDGLAETVKVSIRALDNVIEVGYYPTEKAKRASTSHRPIGLGIMGYQDALYRLGIPFDSNAHLEFADELYEFISFHAIEASNALAVHLGPYSSFKGSKWDNGIFPLDTLDLLAQERGVAVKVNRRVQLDWQRLKTEVNRHGVRNSNLLAIAPTATIAHIVGVSPSIEPTYKNLYAASHLSGDFTVINEYLVKDLEAAGLWGPKLAEALKVADGNLSQIKGLPKEIVHKYREAFQLDQSWLVKAAAARGKWIDQSQSVNLYMAKPSGKLLHEIYMLAWRLGLKTTYYLRTLGASSVEKSTVDTAIHGRTHSREQSNGAKAEAAGVVCSVDKTNCEVCE